MAANLRLRWRLKISSVSVSAKERIMFNVYRNTVSVIFQTRDIVPGMQKLRSVCSWFSIGRSICLALTGLVSVSALGQDAASINSPASQPAQLTDGQTRMVKAAKLNGLTGADMPPCI
jgi:hypothetical protein